MVLITASCTMSEPPSIVLQALCLSDLIPWVCLSFPPWRDLLIKSVCDSGILRSREGKYITQDYMVSRGPIWPARSQSCGLLIWCPAASPRYSDKTVSLFCPDWLSEDPILLLTSWPVYELEEKRSLWTVNYYGKSSMTCCQMKQFSSVQFQFLSRVQLLATPRIAGCQASLFITNSQSLLKLKPIESGMPSNHLIFCRPLLFPPSIFPSARVFSNVSVLSIKWPKY